MCYIQTQRPNVDPQAPAHFADFMTSSVYDVISAIILEHNVRFPKFLHQNWAKKNPKQEKTAF